MSTSLCVLQGAADIDAGVLRLMKPCLAWQRHLDSCQDFACPHQSQGLKLPWENLSMGALGLEGLQSGGQFLIGLLRVNHSQSLNWLQSSFTGCESSEELQISFPGIKEALSGDLEWV